jgi:hypothetical protein
MPGMCKALGSTLITTSKKEKEKKGIKERMPHQK